MKSVLLATEDKLSHAIGARLLRDYGWVPEQIVPVICDGNTKFRSKLSALMKSAALNRPVVLITDLDAKVCAPALVSDWLEGKVLPEYVGFRVAVREIESWILADRQGFSDFLGIAETLVPARPEALPNPKTSLLKLAEKSRAAVAKDIIIPAGARQSKGIGYNRVLASFIETTWDPKAASAVAPSLERARRRLGSLTPP